MAWCKKCGKLISWRKEEKGWIPLDDTPENRGEDQRMISTVNELLKKRI